CEACRDRKIKCSGTNPCRYCSRRQIPCRFRENVKKKLYSIEYVVRLEELAANRSLSTGQKTRYGITPLKNCGNDQFIELPNLQEAEELLDIVLNSLGNIQHLFEPRAFCDRLSEFYSATIDRTDIWYVELLIVLAIGKLLRGRPDSAGTLPGMDLYQEAERHLPGMMSLRREGMTAIEILSMMAFFLQCADLREDAYVHAGMALRLAVANGMANENSYSGLKRSEQAHRCRLWWTVYMQERRLSAATGHPLTIQDSFITTKHPRDAPGFVVPAAMIINIELAKITGQTMDSKLFSHMIDHPLTQKVVYGAQNRTLIQHVQSVQKILKKLQDVAQLIPSEYTLNLTRAPRLSRTAGTLYLMLHQAS
ncbi:Proline utilization trans-activator 3, partial [Colletotrichum chlorophyti]